MLVYAFVWVRPSLTWGICVHFPPLCITTAHQCIIHHPASTALDPIAIMQAPTTAELATFHRVRNPPTAAVTQPHWDPALWVVRTAVFIYEDKDRWRKHLNKMEKNRLRSSGKDQIPRKSKRVAIWNLLVFTWT